MARRRRHHRRRFLSVYPAWRRLLPLALFVVILGGLGSLAALRSAALIGFVYRFGQVRRPIYAYFILFLPMVVILAARPRGLFGRLAA